jgi:hypothetical protein
MSRAGIPVNRGKAALRLLIESEMEIFMSKKEETITIKEFEVKRITLSLIGQTPLIVSAFSEKAKRQMLEAQQKKVKGPKQSREPLEEFVNSLYWLSDRPKAFTEEAVAEAVKNGRFGFKCVSFKESAVSAALFIGEIKFKQHGYAVFHINGELCNGEDFTEIIGDKPAMREDTVRLSGITRSSDLRYRGEFKNWKVNLNIDYLPSLVTSEQIVNWFNYGGSVGGMGEYRIEKGGTFGRYKVGEINTVS